MARKKSQEHIADHIAKAISPGKRKLDFFGSSGTLSTLGANIFKLSVKEAEKSGFRDIEIINDEGFKRRVLLRPGLEGSPLVVFVAGIGLSVTMHSFRDFGLPLAELANWHIALVESPTSGDWLQRNEGHLRLISTGYEGGWDLYLVLQNLRNHSLIAGKFSKLHLMGLSLGGSDAVFSCYFEGILGRGVIDGSVIAWSSPVDRHAGLRDFINLEGFWSILVRMLFSDVYRKGGVVYRHYTDRDPSWLVAKGRNIEEVIEEVYLESSQRYFAKHSHHFTIEHNGIRKIPESLANPLISGEQARLLYCLRSYIGVIQQPVLWIHSENDPVVSCHTNRSTIATMARSDKMKNLFLKQGGHLGYAASHGREWIAKTIFDYVSYWD